jgi:uroporphyrinogen-III decarboxylase
MCNKPMGPPPEGMPPMPPPLPENWASMTGDEKFKFFAEGWAGTEGKPFASPEIAAKYKLRAQRWLDVVALKEPDEIPCTILPEGFVLENAGTQPVDTFYNVEKAAQSFVKFHEDYECAYSAMAPAHSGRTLDALKYKLIRWPGSQVPGSSLADTTSFQYVEKEYMLPQDYDELIANPEGYMMRKFLPKICDGLSGLAMMPNLFNMVEAVGAVPMFMAMSVGQLREALETMLKAADQAMADMIPTMQASMQIMGRFGAPATIGGFTFAPFDIIGDTMRGTRGIMLDMYRHPDKVLAACEALIPISIEIAVQTAMMTRIPFVTIPLHKGADGFMSGKQFEKFYWPSLKAQLLGLIDAGLIPVPIAEGSYNERLDIIAESGLPAGKTVWMMDRTNMKTAKEKFKDFACIGGDVPSSLFFTGTPEAMEDYCKELLESVAPGGGFFLTPGAAIDQAKPENMRAFLNSVKKFDKK